MAITKPEFLKPGTLIKVQHWYGEVVDVAVSDERIMVLVSSPKGIWRNHPAEWLEYDEKQITPADVDDAINSIDVYRERIQKMLADLDTMQSHWQTQTVKTPSL